MKSLLIAAVALVIIPKCLIAQCSDAGVCNVGAGGGEGVNTLGGGYTFGKSGKEDDLTFHTIEITAGVMVFKGSRVVALLPWSAISGPLGSTNGVGDLVLLWDQTFQEDGSSRFSGQLGAKLATGVSNADGLPQTYQPGLGTNDLLAAVAYEMGPWNFGIGYQLSRGRSDNAVTRLMRGDDLMARVGYDFSLESAVIGLETLAIKRLHLSSVLDTAATGGESFVDVADSDQFQINVMATLRLPISETIDLRGLAAVPLIKREVNVDGLTRSVTISVGVEAEL